MQMTILESGQREMFKAGVHAMALVLTVVMDAYNVAAWVQRRQRHLAANALIYSTLAFYELAHVRHHRAAALEAAAIAGEQLEAAAELSSADDTRAA